MRSFGYAMLVWVPAMALLLGGCGGLRLERSALTRETAFRILSDPPGATVTIDIQSEGADSTGRTVRVPLVHPLYSDTPQSAKSDIGRQHYVVTTPFVEGPGELGIITSLTRHGRKKRQVWLIRVEKEGYESETKRVLAQDLPETLSFTLTPTAK